MLLRSLLAVGLCLVLAACGQPSQRTALAANGKPCPLPPSDQVQLKGGTFLMGGAPVRSEEGPPRPVTVGAFEIDRTEVTNAQFAEFVKATGYITLAERKPDPALYPGVDPKLLKPSSLVFVGAKADPSFNNPGLWWKIVDGAQWQKPTGPGSTNRDRLREPVVQVAWEDALAYARWKGRDLPTEAEWEFAARGGLDGKRYEWGDAPSTQTKPRANHWQGVFPSVDTSADGFKTTTAPVGCFAPNGYGLYDMAGNVWEWTRDWYKPGLETEGTDPLGPDRAEARDPLDPAAAAMPKHVIKGGSFLCSDDFCFRYRPAARQPGPPDTGSSHLGFRTVKRLGPVKTADRGLAKSG